MEVALRVPFVFGISGILGMISGLHGLAKVRLVDSKSCTRIFDSMMTTRWGRTGGRVRERTEEGKGRKEACSKH